MWTANSTDPAQNILSEFLEKIWKQRKEVISMFNQSGIIINNTWLSYLQNSYDTNVDYIKQKRLTCNVRKRNFWHVRPTKTQISMLFRIV